MKITGLFFIFFCNLCYSADWGECKLNSYFYDGSIEDIEVSFDRDNKLFIDFVKGNTYWGVSLYKLNKDGSNELLRNNSPSSDGLSIAKLVYKNYTQLVEQYLLHTIKKTERFNIPTVPVTSGYSMEVLFDPESNKKFDVLNFSIAIQEYEKYILFTKIVISSDAELPSTLDVKEVVHQFRNSCSIYDVKE